MVFVENDERNRHQVEHRVATGINFVIGPRGATIRELQQSTQTRIDIDREKNLLIIRGR